MTIAVYALSFVMGGLLFDTIRLRRRLKRLQVRLDESKQKYINDTQGHWTGLSKPAEALGKDPEEFYRDVIDSLPSRSDVYFEVTAKYTGEQKYLSTSDQPGSGMVIEPGLYLEVKIIDFATNENLGTVPIGISGWTELSDGRGGIERMINRVSDRLIEQQRIMQMHGRTETVVNINPYA